LPGIHGPPAPRGVPQTEVTFDIDANGILNVSLFLILAMSGHGYVRLLKPFLVPGARFSEISHRPRCLSRALEAGGLNLINSSAIHLPAV